MILAAGVGSRLDPITRTTPKPMVPVLGLPVIEHIIRLLEQHGFDDIICNTHYLAEQIESYFAHKTDLKAKVSFNREAKLLGTAGGLKRVQDQLGFFAGDEPFLVVGGATNRVDRPGRWCVAGRQRANRARRQNRGALRHRRQ